MKTWLFHSAELPRLLRHGQRLADRELELRGDLAALDGPAVAIVGARAASSGALAFARELAERLAGAGRAVVSGGALGVDGAAHEGALAGRGRTLAVLGTGVDVAYPERHAALFARIVERGLLVSPFPLGSPVRPGNFPTRNPFIAALADALVVVEAGARSGSLGTAQAALRFGQPLFCRPGSPGCDALLLSGRAKLAASAEGLAAHLLGAAVAPIAEALGEDDAGRVLRALASVGDAPTLAARAGLTLPRVLAALLELELAGRAVRLSAGQYLAVSGSAGIKG